MLNQDWQKDGYLISTNKDKLDHKVIYAFLQTSYWTASRTLEQVSNSIANSLCFGLYKQNAQIGFARVITDYATFAYLADVFILPEYQGKGLGKWLIETTFNSSTLNDNLFWLLLTKDAQNLYKKFDFYLLNQAERSVMARKKIP